MESGHQAKKKWKLVILVQVALFVGLFNPWSKATRITAATVLTLEILLLVFVSVPVFLYQIMIKKKKMSEGFQIAIDTVLSSLMLGVLGS